MTQKPIPESLVMETENFSPESVPPKPYVKYNQDTSSYPDLRMTDHNQPLSPKERAYQELAKLIVEAANDIIGLEALAIMIGQANKIERRKKEKPSISEFISEIIRENLIVIMQGEFPKAETLYQQAIEKTKKSIKKVDPDYFKQNVFYSRNLKPEKDYYQDPTKAERLVNTFFNWIRMYLRKDYLDQIRENKKKATIDIHELTQSDEGETTREDQISFESSQQTQTLTGLDFLSAQQESELEQAVREEIEQDPTGELTQCYLREYTQCNCHVLLILDYLSNDFNERIYHQKPTCRRKTKLHKDVIKEIYENEFLPKMRAIESRFDIVIPDFRSKGKITGKMLSEIFERPKEAIDAHKRRHCKRLRKKIYRRLKTRLEQE